MKMNNKMNKKTLASVILATVLCMTAIGVFSEDSDATSVTSYYDVGDSIAGYQYTGGAAGEISYSGSIPGITLTVTNYQSLGAIYGSGTFTTAGTFIIYVSTGDSHIYVISAVEEEGGDEGSTTTTTTLTFAVDQSITGYIFVGTTDQTWTGSVPGLTLTMNNDYLSGQGAVYYSGTPTTQGTYTITSSTGDITIFEISASLSPTDIAPVAYFTYSVDGLEVTFTDESTTPTAWTWDFGDTVTSTSQNPTHTYSEEGSYTVSLTVSNTSETTDTYDTIITVSLDGTTATITYDTGDGDVIESTTSFVDSDITLPAATYTGYVFAGWYYNSTLVGNAGSVYKVTGDITLTAMWVASGTATYNVIFIINGNVDSTQTIVSGGYAKYYSVSALGGPAVTEWYYDSAFTYEYTFTTAVTSSIIIYGEDTFDYSIYTQTADLTMIYIGICAVVFVIFVIVALATPFKLPAGIIAFIAACVGVGLWFL